MKLDKTVFLILSIITIFAIICVCIFARYGQKISKQPSFSLFFNWYIALVMINLINILATLIYNYFMADLPGERGEKGEVGEKGAQGDNDVCFCNDIKPEKINENDRKSLPHSHPLKDKNNDENYGSMIHQHVYSSQTPTPTVIYEHPNH